MVPCSLYHRRWPLAACVCVEDGENSVDFGEYTLGSWVFSSSSGLGFLVRLLISRLQTKPRRTSGPGASLTSIGLARICTPLRQQP
jgi:hypothetical protein